MNSPIIKRAKHSSAPGLDAPSLLSQHTPSTTVQSLADQITVILRDRLILQDIPVGAPINDGEIGKEFGIGRTPVREALMRLEQEHLVTVYPRRGTFASTVDITDISEIAELRAHLEPLAASRAAQHASPQIRDQLRTLASELKSLDLLNTTPTELMRLDLTIHRQIYAASGNKHLEQTLFTYGNLATRIWCMVIDRLPHVGNHITEHISLLTAIAEGNIKEAETIAYEHVLSFAQLVRSTI